MYVVCVFSKVETSVAPDLVEQQVVKADPSGKSWQRLSSCVETFTDSQNPQPIDIETKPAPAKSGLRNRRFGVLQGSVSAEYMRDYINKHGWACYVVCETIEGPFLV